MQPQKCKATQVIIEPVKITKQLIHQKLDQALPGLGRTQHMQMNACKYAYSPIRYYTRARDYIFGVLQSTDAHPANIAHKKLTEHSFRPEAFDYTSGRMSPTYYKRMYRPQRVYADIVTNAQLSEAWNVIASPGRPDPVIRHRKRVEWDHVNNVLK